MSVIFYQPRELGEAAACASIASPQPVGGDIVGMLSRRLAEFSKANAQAFNHTYKEKEQGYSAAEIEREARTILEQIRNAPPPKGACSTARHNFLYNAVANDGTDFASDEVRRAVEQIDRQTDRAAKLYERKDAEFDRVERERMISEVKAGRFETAKPAAGLKSYKPPPPVFVDDEERYDRRTAVNRIKKALKARTGRDFSVKTSDTYYDSIDINVPKARRECYLDGRRSVSQRELKDKWREIGIGPLTEKNAEDLFEYACRDDRELLAKAMQVEPDRDGTYPSKYDCFGSNCTPISVALAEGRTPTSKYRKYEFD